LTLGARSHRRSIEVDRGKKMEDGKWKMENGKKIRERK
jgi:hypothetical protein